MKSFKTLNISGALLDNNQFFKYIEKISAEHNIKKQSDKNTFPIPDLKENFNFIFETYSLLNKHIKAGIKIHSAGEWILDNFYIVEEAVKIIEKEIKLKKYKNLPAISTGKYEGFARIYVLAAEIVAFTECNVNDENIRLALTAYQNKKVLSIEEINLIPLFLKIVLINKIKDVCENIYSAQMQKAKVENIIKRLVENQNVESDLNLNKKINKKVYEQSKFTFIEYMSYRLKKYGKTAIDYQKVLEQEVAKYGLTVSDIIQKEHFYIANLKILVGNTIKSIKNINRINIGEILDNISQTEKLMNLDPSKIYSKMDEETKNEYRNIIQRLAKKAKVSEIYIIENILKLAGRYINEKRHILKKKSHIGFYIVDEGIYELEEIIFERKVKKMTERQKARLYIASIFAITFCISFIFSLCIYLKTINKFLWIISFILLIIPVSEIVIRLTNYIMSKTEKPKKIPKMNYEEKIPLELSSFIVIPSIIKDKEKIKELCRKLEVYYLANKQENLYFALLGDCSQSDKIKEDYDDEIIKTGLEEIRKLNEKYGKSNFNRFHFLYRRRQWSDSESSYIGWERKRGLLVTFNLYIKNKIKNNFLINTIENQKNSMPNIKYIITLDSDTNLVLNTASKLIGAMSHILNIPIIENEKVVKGYGIMQPRVGLDMSNSKKTKFIEIYSVAGGVDFYSNAISDIYQDNFNEGIFTGKGIYDVDVYNEILEKEIPENTVLSHDLLEGNFLRCGLVSDIVLLDGYPKKYIPYILRQHRWTRGDWQIIKWLKSNRLNELSKFKIFDNLRRSLVNIIVLFNIIISIITFKMNILFSLSIGIISIISILISYLIDITDYIIFKKSNLVDTINASKKFSKDFNKITLSFIKILLSIILLPYEAYKNLDAIIRSIYRMKRKVRLLEWVTAEESEKVSKTSILAYYKEMFINIILGLFLLIFKNNILLTVLGILWILAPYIMYKLSLESSKEYKLEENDRQLLIDIGKRTWKFFEDHINEENNYLMIDNYQEDRIEKIVNRTSSTNIGLEILSVISAYDLKYINFEKTLEYIKNIIGTIKILPKWNGHLYNWYNTKTLEPLIPRYISTVDSGNFIGYLYVLKQFLIENNIKDNLFIDIENLINNTDFSVLYSKKIKLLSIGFNIEDNQLTDSYYDFLASEARQASLIAIAKKNIPEKHWNHLSRTLTTYGQYKGLVSWTGTMFEYLMPNITLNKYEGSLLDESSKFAILSQINYCKKYDKPWGISESAYNLKDLSYNYQYKAFGVPWLGLKRGLEEDLVISPYSTILSLEDSKKIGIENIKKLKDENSYGEYGFYEAIDYTPSRLNSSNNRAIVKTYMAHHQGLILSSINNFINSNILRKRFNLNPEIEAVDILLQERMPKEMIITKQKKDRITKLKLIADGNYFERIFEKTNKVHKKINVISNENYQIITNTEGESFSKYKGKLINEYKQTNDIWQGINLYIKNLKNKKITNFYKDLGKVIYNQERNTFIKNESNLKMQLSVTIDPNNPIEIRNLEIKNTGNYEELIEIIEDFVPILSNPNQEYAHPAFNKIFLKVEEKNGNIIVERRDNNLKNNLYLATTLYTENEQIGDFEYEIDREKYIGRENLNIPRYIEEGINFSNEISNKTDYIISMKRTIKLKPGQKSNISLIISVNEDKEKVVELLNKIKSYKEIEKVFELSKARAEEELRYLQVNNNSAIDYYKLLDLIYDENFSNLKQLDFNKSFQKNSLWKFGISGDLPIILVKLKKLEDIYILEEIVDSYKFFRSKKIYIDLIILNEEEEEEYVKNSINELILNKQIEYLKNISSGIFVLEKNKLDDEEMELLNIKAKISIEDFDTLKKYLNSINDEKEENNIVECDILEENNEFNKSDNEYGKFSEDGKEFKIKITSKNKLPTVWSNILANKFFGTLVNENMGGFTWNKNSRLNRLTAWNNNPVLNIPSEIVYIKDIYSNKYWTLNNDIASKGNYEYFINYGLGYSEYINTKNQIDHITTIFVPNNENFKVTKIVFRNNSDQKKRLKIYIYIKNVLGEDEIFTKGDINLKKYKNSILAKNIIEQEGFENKIMFVSSNEKIISYTGQKEEFFGKGDLNKPQAVNIDKLNNENGLGRQNCIGIELEIELQAYEEKKVFYMIGQENSVEKIEEILEEFNSEKLEEELQNTKKNWENTLSNLKVKIPDKKLEKLLNGWLLYQAISSRLYAKSSFYQSGGAYGFRDQLQDCLALKFINPEILKEQIINAARHQFVEGDVLHWWHEETKRGIRTRFSDDLLWLPYSVIEYIEFTDNKNILDEEIEYLNGKILSDNELERYDIFYHSENKETLYYHCKRAIDRILDFGKNGLPRIGTGDWNDGFSNIGPKGIGESVWLGFFLYDILNRFIPLMEYKKDEEINKYLNIKNNLQRTLNTKAWDGRWYKRAITDNNEVLGSIDSEECKIDSISQSWAVISEAGENDKKFISMEAVENYLVDKENKIIKLFWPPFEKGKLNPGYIKAYTVGMRENGGQYTHAAIWYVMALTKLGFGDKALEYLKMISPIDHSNSKQDIEKYKVEPYVITADIYSTKGLEGRGGWSWYTGSASWFYKVAIENILGFNIKNNEIIINPVISKNWKEFEIQYKYKTSIYNIKVNNYNMKNTGVQRIIINGEEVNENKIRLIDNGKIYNIEIFM